MIRIKNLKKTKLLKSNKAITLVALVITVVVLLILAGVSLNLILGKNGIIAETKESKNATEKDAENTDKAIGEITDEMYEALGEEAPPAKISVNEKASKNSTINGQAPSATNPIIPKGYIAINTDTSNWGDGTSSPTEENVNKGLVITDSVNASGVSDGNEWVWVPVSDVSTMYQAGEATLLGTSGGTAVKTSGYSKLRVRSGDSYTVTTPGNNPSGIREPDLVVGSDGTEYDAVQANWEAAGFSSKEGMAQAFVEDYESMIVSISKYHGFYIGRYELTANGEKAGEPLVKTNWYNLYKKCRELVPSGNEKVTTTMIWGCQWDETMNWLKNTVFASDAAKVDSNSSSWGNYNSGEGEPKSTGNDTTYMKNNIYDLAGNCWEWTQEAYDIFFRVTRGR